MGKPPVEFKKRHARRTVDNIREFNRIELSFFGILFLVAIVTAIGYFDQDFKYTAQVIQKLTGWVKS